MIDFKELLLITQQSEDKLQRISIKVIYNVVLLIQTFWFANKLGFQIPINILDANTIDLLFAQYLLLVPLFIFLGLIVLMDLLAVFLPIAATWSVVLWIYYHRRYGLINFWTKRKIENEFQFLSERMNRLNQDLKDSAANTPSKQDQLFLFDKTLKFTISLIIAYHSIVHSNFPEMYFFWVAVPIYFLFSLFLLIQSLESITSRRIYFIERLKRRTQKRLNNLPVS